MDSASLLARYGMRRTLAAAGGATAAGASPTMAAPMAGGMYSPSTIGRSGS